MDMMTQYCFHVRTNKGPLADSTAYSLYSWLLSQAQREYGELLHQQGEKPVSQYLRQEKDRTVWTVSCLNRQADSVFRPVLEQVSTIHLHSGIVTAVLEKQRTIDSLETLTASARKKLSGLYCRIVFASPTAFKHDGRSVIFPQTGLLLRSLAEKWGYCFPQYPIDDPETLEKMERSTQLMDYRLHSCRYALKGVRIPGFTGRVSLRCHLSAPLSDMWKSLMLFSEFSGIGMKTTLGMGGVYLQEETGR